MNCKAFSLLQVYYCGFISSNVKIISALRNTLIVCNKKSTPEVIAPDSENIEVPDVNTGHFNKRTTEEYFLGTRLSFSDKLPEVLLCQYILLIMSLLSFSLLYTKKSLLTVVTPCY